MPHGLRRSGAVMLGLLAMVARGVADRSAIPLNDHERLGQRFVAAQPFDGVVVTVPSWLDAEGGLTLTLWDSPAREHMLARRAFTNIEDNADVRLALPGVRLAGAYYWEVAERTGNTQVGLYCTSQPANPVECAYFDGKPSPGQRFLFEIDDVPTPAGVTASLLKAVSSEDSARAVAIGLCRQLLIVGSDEAVGAMAGLLSDPRASHLARCVLESTPGDAAGEALRGGLAELKGDLLAGAINSIGARGDAGAVEVLSRLLTAVDAEPRVVRAAGAALGRIGTPEAAAVLDGAEVSGVAAARLDCAAGLALRGEIEHAHAIYRALLGHSTAWRVRAGAVRGVVLTDTGAGCPSLVAALRSAEAVDFDAALWVIQHELPGGQATRAAAGCLLSMPPGRQERLAGALCARGDATALPALLELLGKGGGDARRAVSSGLGRFPGVAVAATLAGMLGDDDGSVADVAEAVLRELSGGDADAAVLRALQAEDRSVRVRALRLAATRRMREALPLALKAAAGSGEAIDERKAAAKALVELAGTDDVPVVLGVLDRAAEAGDREYVEALESVLSGIAGRVGDRDAYAGVLARHLAAPGTPVGTTEVVLRQLRAVGGKRALEAVLAATRDARASVSGEAIRALCGWHGVAAAPELLRLSRAAPDASAGLLCLRGYIGLAGAEDATPEQRLDICRRAAALVVRPEDKTLLLGVVGRLAVPEGLEVIGPFLADAAVRDEARMAARAVAANLAEPFDESGFELLFDGTTLSGWEVNARSGHSRKSGNVSGGHWAVEDGAIVGRQEPPGNGGLLVTKASYGAFELALEMNCDFGPDSGIFLRCTDDGRAYQAHVDYHRGGTLMGIYGEGFGAALRQRSFAFGETPDRIVMTPALADTPFPLTPSQWAGFWRAGDWNELRVRIVGGAKPTLTTWINGVRIMQWTETEARLPAEGRIGLQIHGGGDPADYDGKCVRYRKIRVKRLP